MAEAKNFDPVKFLMQRQLPNWLKNAGMKYIVVTNKHHDGFACTNSKSNDFNIVKRLTPLPETL